MLCRYIGIDGFGIVLFFIIYGRSSEEGNSAKLFHLRKYKLMFFESFTYVSIYLFYILHFFINIFLKKKR